eukprot:3576733-Heterocapsa_arctica.AAC.1
MELLDMKRGVGKLMRMFSNGMPAEGMWFTAVFSLELMAAVYAPPGAPRAASRHVGDASAACAACCRLRGLLPPTRPLLLARPRLLAQTQ